MEEDDDLSYVVPEEGSLLWEDTMCIPKGAPNPGQRARVHQLHPGRPVHGAIAEYVRYPCPNAAAMEFIPEADRERPGHVSRARGARALRVRGLQRRGDRGSVPGRADQGLGRLDQRTVQRKFFKSSHCHGASGSLTRGRRDDRRRSWATGGGADGLGSPFVKRFAPTVIPGNPPVAQEQHARWSPSPVLTSASGNRCRWAARPPDVLLSYLPHVGSMVGLTH